MRSRIAYEEILILIKLKSIPNDITIIQAYMPTTQANDKEVEDIYENIESSLTSQIVRKIELSWGIGMQFWVKIQMAGRMK